MGDELARGGAFGPGDKGLVGALATLLSLTSDAVLVFGGDGIISLANDEAERLFRASAGGLVDTDVRLLFPPAPTLSAASGPLETSLPFPLDGSSATVTCEGGAHVRTRLVVRCEEVPLSGHTYLLVAAPADAVDADGEERGRLVEELSRANRRLSGTLRIVLGTLDSLDVGTLFSRILGEVAETMDAWAALAYVAEADGYRLRGSTESLGAVGLPAFMPSDHPLATLVAREGRSQALRVRPPSRDELRGGAMATRTVVAEGSGDAFAVDAATLPPFPSFVVVPVWFGGHMIALLEVGWRHAYRPRKDDVRLLDSVAEYLSVQLAGAFAAMRAQHADRLESLGSTLRERLLAGEGLSVALLSSVFGAAAEGVDATLVPLAGNPHQKTTVAELPSRGTRAVPVDLAARARTHALPLVTDVAEHADLAAWLERHGEPVAGVLVELGLIEDAYRGYLLVRSAGSEPLEEVDLVFVRRLAQDVAEVEAGERVRSRDKHIAQALQRGMRNELQRVDGLSTQSRYSSATEAAFVGGDFYDLVRLPERRACAIMGDVSGKGVEAASVSSAVKTALGAYAWEGLCPADMVRLLNDFLLGFSRLETFATMFVGVADLAAGVLTYCSAGHPPALLVRAETGELVTLGVQSGVVGAFEGMRYQDGEVDVHPGDILLLYTDGVTEARNGEGAFFGEDGLRDAAVREVALGFEGLCDRLIAAVEGFSGNRLSDDVALVVVRFDDVGA